MFNGKISSFSDLLQDRGNISDLLCLYNRTIIGKLSSDELQSIVDYFEEWINDVNFDSSEFYDLCRYYDEELAPALGEVEKEEDPYTIIEAINKREKRPLFDFLREEDLYDWYCWQSYACNEIQKLLKAELDAEYEKKHA